jgi:hypothetical protein
MHHLSYTVSLRIVFPPKFILARKLTKMKGEKYYVITQLHHTVPKIRLMYCIPRNETARPRSQFLHSCICERCIYSQDQSAYFTAAK